MNILGKPIDASGIAEIVAKAAARKAGAAPAVPEKPAKQEKPMQAATLLKTTQKGVKAAKIKGKTRAKPTPARKIVKKAAPASSAPRQRVAAKAPAAKAPPAKRSPVPSAAPAARTDGLKPGSKQAILLDLALAPAGATEAELCKELGWKRCRVTLTRVCDRVGATLDKATKNAAGETIFKATMPNASK